MVEDQGPVTIDTEPCAPRPGCGPLLGRIHSPMPRIEMRDRNRGPRSPHTKTQRGHARKQRARGGRHRWSVS